MTILPSGETKAISARIITAIREYVRTPTFTFVMEMLALHFGNYFVCCFIYYLLFLVFFLILAFVYFPSVAAFVYVHDIAGNGNCYNQ